MSNRPRKPRSQQASRPRPASPKKPAASSSNTGTGGSQRTTELPAMHKTRIKETRFVAILFAATLLVTQSPWGTDGLLPQALRWAGYFLIIICVLGRTWSAAYIGGHKARIIVDLGPYSVTRNPLYVFSFVGAVGIGFSTGMVTPALVIGTVYVVYYRMIVAREEEHLTARHGEIYRDYVARVPRWIPDRKLWQEADEPMGY
ncbi:MAG: isoprenylcysteine carboxylmethyltransferase family protein, partial [Proteobacteria bacterium]|nr:isoprenylcysteine carboxylmethyltransferase family protein [Pseudomonadota bacterium]